MCATLPTLTVSAVYCLYALCRRDRQERARLHHERRLRERVAFMLWVAAHLEDAPLAPVLAAGGAEDDDD
jgi:hypothetical protein